MNMTNGKLPAFLSLCPPTQKFSKAHQLARGGYTHSIDSKVAGLEDQAPVVRVVYIVKVFYMHERRKRKTLYYFTVVWFCTI